MDCSLTPKVRAVEVLQEDLEIVFLHHTLQAQAILSQGSIYIAKPIIWNIPNRGIKNGFDLAS